MLVLRLLLGDDYWLRLIGGRWLCCDGLVLLVLVRCDSLIWWILGYGVLLTLVCCCGLLLSAVCMIGFVGALVGPVRLVCFIVVCC